jgi:hypothetical protein
MAKTQQKIRKTLLFRKLCKLFVTEITARKDYMWIDVPNICNSREEKDFILHDTINRLEQKIKIRNNE